MGQPTSIHWDDFIPMARVLGMISSTIGMIHPNHPNCITGLLAVRNEVVNPLLRGGKIHEFVILKHFRNTFLSKTLFYFIVNVNVKINVNKNERTNKRTNERTNEKPKRRSKTENRHPSSNENMICLAQIDRKSTPEF